jgi:hypothetical protein
MSQIFVATGETRPRQRGLAIRHLPEIAHPKKTAASLAAFENIRRRLTTDRAALR